MLDNLRKYRIILASASPRRRELLGGIDCRKAVSSGYEWTLKDGRVVELRVTIKEADGNGNL